MNRLKEKNVKRVAKMSTLILSFLLAIGQASAQTKTSAPAAKAKAREKINEIIHATLKRSELTTKEGYRIITRMPPSEKDIEQVKSFGDDAIPVLEEYLSSSAFREYELAMRFLGALGGSRIVEPLKKIILFDRSSTKREFALRWITQAPWDQASEIIKQAAESDSDPHVREVAKDLLSGYGPRAQYHSARAPIT